MSSPIPALLRRLRRGKGLSQLALAVAAGTTQRHLSFVESGRARPGRLLLERLSTALELAADDHRQLFAAAGFIAPQLPQALTTAAYAPLRAAALRLVQQQSPYPAMLLDAHYNVLASNSALDQLLTRVAPLEALWRRVSGGRPERNLLRLTFHPEGLVPFMDAPETWVPRQWARMLRDAQCPALMAEIAAWPHLQRWLKTAEADDGAPALLERYRLGTQPINLMSMMAVPGVPTDITAASLRVNLLFPADQATDRWLTVEARRAATARASDRPDDRSAP